jgi:hypothetical protein
MYQTSLSSWHRSFIIRAVWRLVLTSFRQVETNVERGRGVGQRAGRDQVNPVAAIAATLSSVTLPEASNSARPSVIWGRGPLGRGPGAVGAGASRVLDCRLLVTVDSLSGRLAVSLPTPDLPTYRLPCAPYPAS